jgi:murein DD-endopeptidase MepM/ murein hydrolase activator NlpD
MSKIIRLGTAPAARLMAPAAAAVLALALGACSTDVQRFGATSSITPAGDPLGRVESAPLQPISLGTQDGQDRYAAADMTRRPPSPLAGPSPLAPGGLVTVRTSDTMYSIADANGITVDQLAAANNLTYPYSIRIGQQLALPGRAAPAPVRQLPQVAQSGGSHVVAPGDTLFNISQRYGVGVADLAGANNLSDYGTIRIGQTLVIPRGGSGSGQGGHLQTAVRDTGSRTDTQPRVFESRTVVEDEDSAGEAVARAEPDRAEPLPNPPERASTGQFRWPVRGRIISHYGVGADGVRNDGINIAVPAGASVKAAENGVVAYAGDELKGYGNLILVRHANDWVTAYAHNSEILVRRGDTVKRGEIIAKAGQSGSVDQPQVHFEVRQGSKAVDPMGYLDGA